MKTSVVLFDLDGTMVNSLPFIIDTYKLVFDKLNLPWADGEVVRWIGRPLKEIAGYFAGEREEEFLKSYEYYYNLDFEQNISLFPGTLEMLDRLREKGMRLGIVTSKGRGGTERTVKVAGLDRYMEVIVTAQDVSIHKPFPEPVLEALRLLGALPQQAIYVGDSFLDVEAGKKAGVTTLAVTWGITAKEELAGLVPDGLLDSWTELEKFIV
jgi:pyrophosphatase PpaX